MGGYNTITPKIEPLYPKIIHLIETDKVEYHHTTISYTSGFITIKDVYTDKAIEAICNDLTYCTIGRFTDINNTYFTVIDSNKAGADYRLSYLFIGRVYEIGFEAVDLPAGSSYLTRLSIVGSTLKAYRVDLSTPKISATNTVYTSGKFGVGFNTGDGLVRTLQWSYLKPPTSPAPKVIGYFEVEIIGSGTSEDPFRPSLPEDIRDGVNVLALTHSVLVKTGSDGKPVEYRGILRVFDQPDRPSYLAPIDKALEALRAMPGVRELTREQAIAMAKRLDDKLHDLDLRSARELGLDKRKAGRDYMSWRVFNLGVREELLDISIQERYAEEDKGW